MGMVKIKIEGDVVKNRVITTQNGKKIQEFLIGVSTKDYQSDEWFNKILPGKLIGEFPDLEEKSRYVFTGKLDVNQWTNKDGETISELKITAFHVDEDGEQENTREEKKAVKKIQKEDAEVSPDELPF